MNDALEQLAARFDLPAPRNERLRLQFGYECTLRIQHLLEEPEVVECLAKLGQFLDGKIGREAFAQAQTTAARLANQHRGSKSIDGCGHAAVSASYGVANAVNGKAIEAASYCAYASVYAGGGYAAVAVLEAFEPEFSWQIATLNRLAAGIEPAATPVPSA